jgi:flagellar basal-body rod protein FlgC
MELMQAMNISASGMKVQGDRMRVVSQNLANADTTPGTPDEQPYRRKMVTFKNELDRQSGYEKVVVDKIKRDNAPFRTKYDPQHPAANNEGYVQLPNVNPLIEMMDMREAQRSYEANLGAIEISRNMVNQTIQLLRGQ